MTVVAFAGHGAIHGDNVVALLNDWFGVTGEDEEGYPIFPDENDKPTLYYVFDKPLKGDDGFKAAFQYSEYAWLDFYPIVATDVADDSDIKKAIKDTDNEADVTDDVPSTVVKYLKGRGTLVVLWGDEDEADPNTQAIVEAAIAADIKVLDLTSGLDSISFEDAQGIVSVTPEDAGLKEPTRTPQEMVSEPQELTQPQDEAQQQTAPDHLRVDSATQQGVRPGVVLPNGPSPAEYTNPQTLLWQFATMLAPYVAEEIKRLNLLEVKGDSVPSTSEVTPEPEPKKTRGRPRKGESI